MAFCAARPLDSSSAMRCSLIRNPRNATKQIPSVMSEALDLDIGSGSARTFCDRRRRGLSTSLSIRVAIARVQSDPLHYGSTGPRTVGHLATLSAWMPPSRWSSRVPFSGHERPGQVVLSLDRVPGCEVFRAGDGVHAAWLERRSRFESAWKRRLRIFNLKHAALLGLERQVFESVRLVIANSRMVAEEIVHWHDFPESRIRVVHNGIGSPIPRISRGEEARRRFEIPDQAFCVLFVGTGWERKGCDFAIEAVETLGGDALLLVAGRGNTAQYRSPRAKFLGAVEDLPALYSAADVFTLPTIYDPFSNACLEATAAGLPVVTTTANGFSEISRQGCRKHRRARRYRPWRTRLRLENAGRRKNGR